jgi:hypothetical protein
LADEGLVIQTSNRRSAMNRCVIPCLFFGLAAWAGDLPDVSLATAKWTCTDGASIKEGVATLVGEPGGYIRVFLPVAGEALAGKTVRFSAMVRTRDIKPGKPLPYASPKLKIVDEKNRQVKGVVNFASKPCPEWTSLDMDLTVPKDQKASITLELGLQLCRGVFEAKDVKLEKVKPWRWRVLDGDHKSYFDKPRGNK